MSPVIVFSPLSVDDVNQISVVLFAGFYILTLHVRNSVGKKQQTAQQTLRLECARETKLIFMIYTGNRAVVITCFGVLDKNTFHSQSLCEIMDDKS
jgi:hypothetical protein